MVGRAILAVLLVCALGGCKTNPETGEEEFTRESCEELAQAFELAKIGCVSVPDHDDAEDKERNRRYCEAASSLVNIAFDLGCPFADEVRE